jgi:hypothetical protein
MLRPIFLHSIDILDSLKIALYHLGFLSVLLAAALANDTNSDELMI